jgi:hypothetical protein
MLEGQPATAVARDLPALRLLRFEQAASYTCFSGFVSRAFAVFRCSCLLSLLITAVPIRHLPGDS